MPERKKFQINVRKKSNSNSVCEYYNDLTPSFWKATMQINGEFSITFFF